MEIRDYHRTETKSRQLEGELRLEALKSSRMESLVQVHKSRVEQKEGAFKLLKDKLLSDKENQSPRQRFESARNVCKEMIAARKAAIEEKTTLQGVEKKKKGSDALLSIKKKQIDILQRALTEGKRILASRKEETVFQMELDSLITCRAGALKNAILSTSSLLAEKADASVLVGGEAFSTGKQRIGANRDEKSLDSRPDIKVKEEVLEFSHREAFADILQENGSNQNQHGQRQQEQGAKSFFTSNSELDPAVLEDTGVSENPEPFDEASKELQQQIEKLQSWRNGQEAGVELSYTSSGGQKITLQVEQDTEKNFSVTIITDRSGNNWNLRADRQLILKALEDAGLKVRKINILARGQKTGV